MDTKICTKCKKILPITEFYSRGNGKLRSECKNCHKNYVKQQYNKRKDLVNDIKANYKCAKCGENRFYVLDFHHLNPDDKNNTIARLTANTSKIENIQTEIDKCIVLCANCHREFHYLKEQNNIDINTFLTL